jgi:hypothetical protein
MSYSEQFTRLIFEFPYLDLQESTRREECLPDKISLEILELDHEEFYWACKVPKTISSYFGTPTISSEFVIFLFLKARWIFVCQCGSFASFVTVSFVGDAHLDRIVFCLSTRREEQLGVVSPWI